MKLMKIPSMNQDRPEENWKRNKGFRSICNY